MSSWYVTKNSEQSVALGEIPKSSYKKFRKVVAEQLPLSDIHIGHYFARKIVGNQGKDRFELYCILLNDATSEVMIAVCELGRNDKIESLSREFPAINPFEREITELFGIKFAGSPWSKPLRFPHDQFDENSSIDNYPFYKLGGDSYHEVNVGPIHAGIIEPGAFRFLCNGERVLHLEIVLGYQHRGVENMMTATRNRLRQNVLAESIAGDSVVSHTSAFAAAIEKLNIDHVPHSKLDDERVVAMELERMAMHIADTGALCADIGYQLGQVASEALRTIVINTSQMWCGNRFSRSLIKPYGSHYPITYAISEEIINSIKEVRARYLELFESLVESMSILSRFEDCGVVDKQQLINIGVVGMAARAGGLNRDIRKTHPYGAWNRWMEHEPVVCDSGDVMARFKIRGYEVLQSADYIYSAIHHMAKNSNWEVPAPDIDRKLKPEELSFGLVEGWRGELCHVAITDKKGELELYKIKDPSLHNWTALAVSMRGEGISDFPINNKSFNLSYSGHDL